MSIRHYRPLILLLLAILAMFALGIASATSQETQPVVSTAKDGPEEHLGKGYEALKHDRYDVAASEFRAALKSNPKLVLRARFPLAVALFELHKSEEARREFEAVRREVGDHPNVLYYLGRLDLTDSNFVGAIGNLTKAITKPPFPDTAYYLGFAYFKQGDLAAAERWLKEAIEKNPGDARIPYQLALVYRKEGLEEEARKALALSDDLRQRDDNESRLRMECGQKLAQGFRDEAHSTCEQLYDPNSAEKLTALGTIYGQHGDLQAALKPLRRAAELAPQSPQTQYNLALIYYQLNQFEQSRASLVGAIKRWPDLFQLNALYGAVLLKLGEDLGAYQALHHAIELNPQDSATADLLYITALGLAQKKQNMRHYSDSLPYLQEATRLRPYEPKPHERMAEIYALTGRPAQARSEQLEANRLAKSQGTRR